MELILNSLYFSPFLDGHRASYCQYFLKILIIYFKTIFVVTNNIETSVTVKTMLQPYIDSGHVKLVKIEDGLNINADEFIELQNKLEVDLTIIEEADNHLVLINQQVRKGGRRLRGKTIGIFLRSINYVYRRQLYSSGWSYWKDELRRLKHINKRWDNDSILFHEFLLPKFHLLDRAICLDEYFVKHHGLPHVWMPDIYFSLEEENSMYQTAELARHQELLKCFLARNQEHEKILYFGGADPRKGFDTLLKLAVDENACFIHCGLRNIPTQVDYRHDIGEMKALLIKEDRLMEIDNFLLSRAAVELFFKSVNYIVLPYRRHLGSSGAMLLALSFNKPVLVPDDGLMAKRVKDNSLGMIYRYEDYEDLRNNYIILKSQPIGQYSLAIRNFMSRFTEEKTLATIERLILDSLGKRV